MSPRLLLLTGIMVLSGATASALDLKGMLSDPSKLKKGLETVTDAGKLVSGLGPEEESALGETVALELIGRFGGLVRDEAIVQRVNLVGRSLARYSARPDHLWRFGVLNSSTINAFSAPDGYVFITRGLYELVDDDDQLAAVLAHEIIHITGRDALRMIETGEKGNLLLKHVAMRSSDTREAQAYLNQLGVTTDKIVKFIVERGFDHPTEFTADGSGHALAVTAGYAPGALRAVLVRLQQMPAGPQKAFSTHPALSERIKRLPAGAVASGTSASTQSSANSSSSSASTETASQSAAAEVDDEDRAFAEAADNKPAKKKRK